MELADGAATMPYLYLRRAAACITVTSPVAGLMLVSKYSGPPRQTKISLPVRYLIHRRERGGVSCLASRLVRHAVSVIPHGFASGMVAAVSAPGGIPKQS